MRFYFKHLILFDLFNSLDSFLDSDIGDSLQCVDFTLVLRSNRFLLFSHLMDHGFPVFDFEGPIFKCSGHFESPLTFHLSLSDLGEIYKALDRFFEVEYCGFAAYYFEVPSRWFGRDRITLGHCNSAFRDRSSLVTFGAVRVCGS